MESRPVSLIRRGKAPLGWSLPHGCFPWTTCLPPSPRNGWPKPQACPGLLRTPDKKRHRPEGGPPPTPQACGQGPRDGARREGTQEALRHTDGTWPLPTGPVGHRGSGAQSAAGRPCPGCGWEGKGPRGRCPAVPAACLLALPLSHRVEAPLARPLLLAARTCEVSGTPFPPELEATCSGRALETVWRRLSACRTAAGPAQGPRLRARRAAPA